MKTPSPAPTAKMPAGRRPPGRIMPDQERDQERPVDEEGGARGARRTPTRSGNRKPETSSGGPSGRGAPTPASRLRSKTDFSQPAGEEEEGEAEAHWSATTFSSAQPKPIATKPQITVSTSARARATWKASRVSARDAFRMTFTRRSLADRAEKADGKAHEEGHRQAPSRPPAPPRHEARIVSRLLRRFEQEANVIA